MKNVRENEITYQELTSIIVGTVLGWAYLVCQID